MCNRSDIELNYYFNRFRTFPSSRPRYFVISWWNRFDSFWIFDEAPIERRRQCVYAGDCQSDRSVDDNWGNILSCTHLDFELITNSRHTIARPIELRWIKYSFVCRYELLSSVDQITREYTLCYFSRLSTLKIGVERKKRSRKCQKT